jgi:hypothetical protein
MPAPIRLSDAQLSAVMAAARPLPVAARDQFLREVAERLQGHEQLGDGVVGRVAAEVQKRYRHPEPKPVR